MKNNIYIWLTCLSITSFLYSCKEDKKADEGQQQEQAVKSVSVPEFNADSAYKYVEKQVNFGPRVPNTPAHKKCGDYLINVLTSLGAKVDVQEFQAKAFDGTTLNLRNIKGSVNPEATKRILLASHWDSRPFADQDSVDTRKPIDGANDGASGVGILIELVRAIKTSKAPDVGVDVLFFDGEDYGQPDFYKGPDNPSSWCLGSQYWAKNKGDYNAFYGILLDMVGAKNAKFAMEGASMQYAPSVVRKVWDAGNKLGYPQYFIYQPSGAITDDHIYVNQMARIPMIDIIDYDDSDGIYFGHYWHTHKDNMSVIDRNSLKAVGQTLLYVVYHE